MNYLTTSFTDKDRDQIIQKYSPRQVKEIKFIDSSRDNDDLRWVSTYGTILLESLR
jgi:hypothetical protein